MKRADRMDIISEKWRSTIALSRSFFFFFMNSTMIRFEFLEALSHLIMFSIYNTPFTKSSREERHLIAKTRKLVKLSRRRRDFKFKTSPRPPALEAFSCPTGQKESPGIRVIHSQGASSGLSSSKMSSEKTNPGINRP